MIVFFWIEWIALLVGSVYLLFDRTGVDRWILSAVVVVAFTACTVINFGAIKQEVQTVYNALNSAPETPVR